MIKEVTKKDLQAAFADALHSYRKTHRLSQSKMAKLLDIHERCYVDLEHGRFCPSAITLVTFMGVLPVEARLSFIEKIISPRQQGM